jgi:hypothetical protein
MAEYRKAIAAMKRDDRVAAEALAIAVRNADGASIGSLVPVGPWILRSPAEVDLLKAWRQRAMRMFLAQFESTFERTYAYLEKLSIGQEGRLLFLLRDDADRVVGHLGVAEVDGRAGELDNLVRGVDGGDPRLVYFAELTLLHWCFRELTLEDLTARVVSYNWLVIALHEEVGFRVVEQLPLRKVERDGTIFHDPVPEAEANVRYRLTRMRLARPDFYARAPWL